MRTKRVLALAGGCLLLTIGAARAAEPAEPPGYLAPAERPDAARLLGPPPAPGTGAYAGDAATYRYTRALKGGPRWTLAVHDADFGAGPMMGAFSCALGVALTPRDAPALDRLLSRLAVDTEDDERPAKAAYHRPRPFLADGGPICVAPEDWLKKSASYPSGHATYSWAAGLVMAEIAPSRAGEIMARARSYGDSRVVCGVHYETDVQAGRAVGAAVFAALQANPAFKADLEAARAELVRLRTAPPAALDPAQCRIEAEAAAHPVW
ncbi:MAG: phosphatase PAP2 family protein [Caulobacteraceae bacterium]|nr:phosphatase PAP2 family protein [Caulobacteraceae bacterium]